MLPASAQPRVCSVCKVNEFWPRNSMHVVCGYRCASKLAKAAETARKLAQKVEKAQDRAKKEKLKSRAKWEDECRTIVQKIARIRDRNDGCISCHLPASYGNQPGNWGRQWHGSHYRSVGACSNTQFHLWNIHKSCASCNKDKGGNREFYRPRLIEKIGLAKVEWLDAQNNVNKRSGPGYIEYLKRFKAVMGKRLRRIEKRAEQD